MFSEEERGKIAAAQAQLSAIPEDEFDMYVYTNSTNKCCAVGHLQRLDSPNPNDYTASNCSDYATHRLGTEIRELSRRFLKKEKGLYQDITDVNNRDVPFYNQFTVKERVLALLTDMLNYGTNK